LTVHRSDKTRFSIGGLDEEAAVSFRHAVLQAVGQYVDVLGPYLDELDCRVDQVFAGVRYVRYSESSQIRDELGSVIHRYGMLVRNRLEPSARAVLERLAPLQDTDRFETERSKANRHFVQMSLPRVKDAARSVLSYPLTDEQAEAIATNEDATLVLAGAGTGKTATIVGKVAHLVRNENVPPDEILVLAYNRKAAKEIRGRLPRDLSRAQVSTFHAYGRWIIGESDRAPSISDLAGDRIGALTNAMEKIVTQIVTDPEQPADVTNFIVYHHRPYRSVFDFATLAEYEEWVRTVELRTLNGELVKSSEELAIANYLAENGIIYEYERDYPVDTATRSYRQYQPDFYLPNNDIYLEHFALDEQGRPPGHWNGYAEGVVWKRGIHNQHGSTLVETYSWQHRKGVLLESLQQILEQKDVKFQPIPRWALLSDLSTQMVSRLTKLLVAFLNHVKTSGLTPDQLRERAHPHRDHLRCLSFLRLFDTVSKQYEQLLADDRAVDFHDLINKAVTHLREGRVTPRVRYVLVDEFQDISRGRMTLLQALAESNVAWFLVGDDWQSIYRFAGSDVGLVRNCSTYLGHTREQTLSETFRFGHRILGPSTAFVQRNPEQTKRPLRSRRHRTDTGVTVIAETDPPRGVQHALDHINTLPGRPERPSVLVLGRYRFSRNVLPPPRQRGSLNVQFSTVHSAKGKEADYVIVVDLNDHRMGFPCRVEDDPLLDLVLPPPSGKTFPYAEERRLFYVAITRARIGTYLITDLLQPSTFVTELLDNSGNDISQIGAGLAPKCARCHSGRLTRSQSGKNLRCSNYPTCDYQTPRCNRCNTGYSLLVGKSGPECTNPSCNDRPTPCPLCHIGILTKKRNRHGSHFWGCTRYWSQPSCRYTQNNASRRPTNPYRR
jgi:DNA helicase-4